MARTVTFRPGAAADLKSLYDYIVRSAGQSRADGYLTRIEAACLALAECSERGTRRDDIAPGVRTIGFERRVLIAFRLLPRQVEILAVLYAGRELTSDFPNR